MSKLKITPPYHSESRTIWYVTEEDAFGDWNIIATLELGQMWEHSSLIWELVQVNSVDNTVGVKCLGFAYDKVSFWPIYSLVKGVKV